MFGEQSARMWTAKYQLKRRLVSVISTPFRPATSRSAPCSRSPSFWPYLISAAPMLRSLALTVSCMCNSHQNLTLNWRRNSLSQSANNLLAVVSQRDRCLVVDQYHGRETTMLPKSIECLRRLSHDAKLCSQAEWPPDKDGCATEMRRTSIPRTIR